MSETLIRQEDGESSSPRVSVIVPCYNEEKTIHLLLQAIWDQTFDHSEIEVVIADGLSTDKTRRIIEDFRQSHENLTIRVIDNPTRTIPAGLNLAIEAAQGEFLVRLDAHSVPYPDYVSRSVDALIQGHGDNVGGVWEIQPSAENWLARSIAGAAAHPLGAGDARYRTGGSEQEVDTVPFGAYRKSKVIQIGSYDESLLTNEDYEFNVRIRQYGGKVWLDPAIRSVYYARPDLLSLAKQYFRYGFWKAVMLRRYPHTLRWRQLAPLFVLSLVVMGIAGFFYPYAWWLLGIEIALYSLILGIGGLQSSISQRDLWLFFGVPLAIATMHLSWGSGFLWSFLFPPRRLR